MRQEARSLPAEFWAAPRVASALASCDFATLLEEIRQAYGWKQADLAVVVGYSQSWVSKVLRGAQALTTDQVRDISRLLGIPLHLLRFSDLRGEDPTNRRDFGKALTLALLPSGGRSVVDENTAATLTAITGSQRRLDATAPARDLTKVVIAHLEMGTRIYSRTRRLPVAPKVAAAVSEAAGFAAWLYADMQDIGSARRYYRQAIDSARRAEDDLLAGYMIGSLAAFEIECDDSGLGLALLGKARKQIESTAHPTPMAWLASMEALAHAGSGDGRQRATDAILRAEKAVNTRCDEPPPWPWVFPFDHAKLARYRAAVAVRLNQPSEALAAFAESLTAVQPAPKQRAVVMLEVATALRQAGEGKKDAAHVDEAFRLAGEALTMGLAFSSERVIQRARRFRREYSGPATQRTREFDEELRRTLP